ncbi:MAG: release factor glutamine methyltransferase [Parvicella sp.]|jgi:release factor glutamine methyltransferase
MIQALKKRVYGPILQTWCKIYFRKPRKYQYEDIKGVVLPSVFFPHFTVSTSLLIDYIKNQDLLDKEVLELGCGTGLVSVAAAKRGANVLATDINLKALENVQINAGKNGVTIEVLESNLFQNLENRKFDYIIINPPYYPKQAQNIADTAWYCGESFEYFQQLFSQIGNSLLPDTEAIMILSEDCEVGKIIDIAISERLVCRELYRIRRKGEINIIFKITNRPEF